MIKRFAVFPGPQTAAAGISTFLFSNPFPIFSLSCFSLEHNGEMQVEAKNVNKKEIIERAPPPSPHLEFPGSFFVKVIQSPNMQKVRNAKEGTKITKVQHFSLPPSCEA